MKIKKVSAREIYDSRGWPTVQCELTVNDGTVFITSTPSGLSKGHYEAHELRDGDKRLWGKGVTKAIELIEEVIAPGLVGKEPHGPNIDILMIDMDGTVDKSYLGANSILAVSTAVYKAHAHQEQLELYELIAYLCGANSITIPLPQFNVINGGLHGPRNNMQIQEFLLIPIDAPRFRQAMEISMYVYHELKNILYKYGKSSAVGDEGGFAPQDLTDREALDYLMLAIEKSQSTKEHNFVIGLDCAANQYYDQSSGLYRWQQQSLTNQQLINVYHELIETYAIYSLEDPIADTDVEGWKLINSQLGQDVQIVGDDLFATNFNRIEHSIKEQLANAAIIKPNQIGTITETLQAINLCRTNDIHTIVANRSGETCETFIADLAVGTSAGQLKAGGCSRGERIAKYNRLLTIEDSLLADTTNRKE